MPRRAYKSINLKPASRELLDTCREVIREYRADGLKLSLRQLYYQLVSEDIIPNDDKEYKKLGALIGKARLIGEIDWDAIEDRNREPDTPAEFESLSELIEAAIHSYRLPRCKGQSYYLELWVEKAALANVLLPLAREYHATLMVNRGYSSLSAMFESAQRIDRRCRYMSPRGRYDSREGELCVDEAIILYLGDLDPSGEDMVRDIEERLTMFLDGGVSIDSDDGRIETPDGWNTEMVSRVPLTVEKIALTMDQVREYQPPPNPAKRTDSRSKAFMQRYGASSWEVDALRPNVLRQIIRDAFEEYMDLDMMQEFIDQEEVDKAQLRELQARSREEA